MLRGMSTTYPGDLPDAEWACTQRYLPSNSTRGGPRTRSQRRETWGVVLFAKTVEARRALVRQFDLLNGRVTSTQKGVRPMFLSRPGSILADGEVTLYSRRRGHTPHMSLPGENGRVMSDFIQVHDG
jgi:hypothetical protein